MNRLIVDDNDFVAGCVAPKRPLPPFNETNEAGNRHSPLASRAAAALNNSGNTSKDFNSRRLTDENDAAFWNTHGQPLPRSVSAERFGIAPHGALLIKPLTEVVNAA